MMRLTKLEMDALISAVSEIDAGEMPEYLWPAPLRNALYRAKGKLIDETKRLRVKAPATAEKPPTDRVLRGLKIATSAAILDLESDKDDNAPKMRVWDAKERADLHAASRWTYSVINARAK